MLATLRKFSMNLRQCRRKLSGLFGVRMLFRSTVRTVCPLAVRFLGLPVAQWKAWLVMAMWLT